MTWVADDQPMLDMFEEGQQFVEEAEAWIAKNPYAWGRIVSKAAEYAGQGRRFSIARLVEDVRWEMKIEGVTEWRVNNNHRAVFARKLQSYPNIAPYIQTRSSKVDGLI